MRRVIPIAIGTVLGAVVVGICLFLFLTLIQPPPAAPANEPAQAGEAAEAPVNRGPTEVAALVNDEAITPEMVEREVEVSRFNLVEAPPPLTGQDLALAREEALNQLITRHLILQAASRQNFRLDEAEVESRVDLLFGSYGQDVLNQTLSQAGLSRQDLAWWVREIATVEAFTTQVIMAGAAAEERQQVYNEWLNNQRATARIQTFVYMTDQARQQSALIGQPAADFSLTTPDGQSISLSDYAGKVVLVNFWATWCPSCITEMPDYEQVYQRYGQGQGEFVVLGVNFQEDPAQVAQYAAGLGVTFPVVLDQDGQVATHQYQVTGMPASIIVDREGVIFYRHLGPMSAETLESKLAELGL